MRDVLYMTVPFGVCNRSANLGRFTDKMSLLDSVSTAKQSFVATADALSPAYSSRRLTGWRDDDWVGGWVGEGDVGGWVDSVVVCLSLIHISEPTRR